MRNRVAVALAALLTLAAGAQPPSPAQIVIDASQVISDVSPLTFGANFGPLNAVPVDLIDAAKESGIHYLRFPGGRVGDLGDVTPSQIDMYMTVCRMLDCTPAISARLEGGTPEKAAELVRYVNIEKGYGVRYWSVGNEADLFDNYTAERAAAEWRPIAEAMLEVDPDIIFIGPDTSQFTGEPNEAQLAHEFLREFLRQNGDMIDIVSVHRYPFGDPAATVDGLRTDAARWTTLIANLHAIAKEELGREVPVAITEVNSHWSSVIGGAATPDSHANALWWADVFGQIAGGDIEIVGYFNFQSSDRLGGHGLLGRYEVRPTYYAYQLYTQFGTQVVSATHDGDIRAYAALREDGALTVALINWADAESTTTLDISGFDTAGAEAEITTYDATTDGLVTSTVGLSPDAFLTLTPLSINLIVIPSEVE
jgi:hypothetical protein